MMVCYADFDARVCRRVSVPPPPPHPWQKKVEQFQQEAQAAQVTLASESTRWQTKLERMESDHLAESQSAQDALSKLRDKEGDMLSLQSSVADLWTRCCNNSELVRATDKEEGYLLHEPLEMISALQELLLMHAPTEAGRSNRQLQAYANRVWRTHFKSRPQLKNKTLDIFRALHDYLTASLAAVEEEKAKAARLRKQIKEVKVRSPGTASQGARGGGRECSARSARFATLFMSMCAR